MLALCVYVCAGGWLDECVQNWIHSYVNRRCMCACMCRRDPYHGVMRSATVGYPQTLVIMAAVKRTDAEGRMDAFRRAHSAAHRSQSPRQEAAG